jgi:nicotinamidase-related amidase
MSGIAGLDRSRRRLGSVSRMKTLPKTAVLLLVDLQQGFDDPRWGRRNNPQMEARVADLLSAFRASKRRVMHAKHMSDTVTSPLRPGQPGNHFKVHLAPAPGELVIEKRVNSSFIGTSLEKILRRDGHDTLVIAGLTTNHCVSTTARMAGNLGFNVLVVSDATATFDRAGPDGVDHAAEEIQAIALSDLHGEFATVVDTNAVLSAVQPRVASMRSLRPPIPKPASRRGRTC